MKKVVINLTTTHSRVHLCAQAVYSLINQTVRPDVIRLWVSREPYLRDQGMSHEPDWVAELRRLYPPIEVHYTANTGPYRKLIPTLRRGEPDDITVTADDDIIYGPHWLESMLRVAREHPQAIVAARVRQVRRNPFGVNTSYMQWPILTRPATLAGDFVVTFGGGTVIPPGIFRPDLVQSDAFLTVCPTTDDLWYSMMAIESGVSVVVCPEALTQLHPIEHNQGLEQLNMVKSATLIKRVYEKIVLNLMGWLGMSICNNDEAYKRIRAHVQAGFPPAPSTGG